MNCMIIFGPSILDRIPRRRLTTGSSCHLDSCLEVLFACCLRFPKILESMPTQGSEVARGTCEVARQVKTLFQLALSRSHLLTYFGVQGEVLNSLSRLTGENMNLRQDAEV